MVATNKRPVYGVGINDSETTIAKYKTIFKENGFILNNCGGR